MKVCRNCGKTKELDEFYNDKSRKDGKYSYCKVCANTRKAEWKAKAQPCVYRIKHKVSGLYYLGQTSQHLSQRVSCHFSSKSNLISPFTGLNKEEYKCEVLCYGTKKEVKALEKALLITRVGKDPLCMNRNI